MSTESPSMVSVPSEPLAELEAGFSRLWFTVNKAAVQIEKGTDPQFFAPLLREELSYALQKFHNWRFAKWANQGGSGDLMQSPVERNDLPPDSLVKRNS